MSTRPALATLVAVLTLSLTGACSTEPTTTTDRTRSTVTTSGTTGTSGSSGSAGGTEATGQRKTGTGEVRHDLDPLTKRFSALGTPVSATWMSGTLDSSAPGPSTYWIDAVVQLSPETAATLRDASPTPTAETPEVEGGVRAALPSGQLLRSGDLDALFAQGPFRAKAYLSAGSDTVVLVSLGQ
ncbi:MAG: hypothetical protein ABI336_06245 [Humibacillus sp.]